MNESTVRKRIGSLKRRRIIRRFTVDVDAEKLGIKTRAFLGVDVEPSKILDVGRQLAEMTECRFVFNVAGHHDFWAIVWARDREALLGIIQRISAIEGVTSVNPSILAERLK